MLIKQKLGQTYKRVLLLFPMIIFAAATVVWSSLNTVSDVSSKAQNLVEQHIPELRELAALQSVMNRRVILLHEYYATTDAPDQSIIDAMHYVLAQYLVKLQLLGVNDQEINDFNIPLLKFQQAVNLFNREMQRGNERDWDKLRDHLAIAITQAGLANMELRKWNERIRNQLADGGEKTLKGIAQLNSVQLGFSLTVLFVAALLLAILYARMKDQAKLFHYAHNDQLTCLPNRRSLQTYEKSAMSSAESSSPKILLFISLDRFSLLTSTFGHQFGDQLIKIVSAKLETLLNELSESMHLFSFDRANWVICVADADGNEVGLRVADAIRQLAFEPIVLNEREINFAFSIGISYFPEDALDLPLLLSKADTARRQALNDGGGCFRVYEEEMSQKAEKSLSLETGIRKALVNDEFELYYQPKLSIDADRVACAEALIRWNRGEEFISPGDFIPVAEQTGLVIPIGEWVLEAVCHQWVAWFDLGMECPPIAVNISAQQFQLPDFPELVKKVLKESGMPANMLELEITEEAASGQPEQVVSAMQALKEIGVTLAIDDFGTGYSSLSYLKRFPIDVLKIDRAFVSQMEKSSQDKAIVDMVIAMSHELGFEVVAEGVETEVQWMLLKEMRCNLLQGYFFSRPLSSSQYSEYLSGYSTDIRKKIS